SIVELRNAARELLVSKDVAARRKAFQMQPVLISAVEQTEIRLHRKLAGVTAVCRQFRQVAFCGAVSILEAGAKLHTIMRDLLDVNLQGIRFVNESGASASLRTNRW